MLLVQYAHTPCLVQALRAHLDGQTYHEAAEHYGRNFNSFKRHMKRAGRLLKAAYAA
jgi:DNA-directed RNA polymerase specialized sigma24 family protein